MTKTFDEDAALCFDPFEGDFGDGEKQVANEIITAPEPPRCAHCHGKIKPGTRIRRLVEQVGDEDEGDEPKDIRITEYLYCEPCCKAMAVYGTEKDWEGDRYERRTLKYQKD